MLKKGEDGRGVENQTTKTKGQGGALLPPGCVFLYVFVIFLHIGINGEREVPGRRKVVRGSNVLVLISHVGQNPRSKSGYEPKRRVIKEKKGAKNAKLSN